MKLMRNMFATHTDYADLKGVIPSNPSFVPSNVDGICERKGKFLIMEWKRQNEKVSMGQQILLKALAANDDFMVVIIYGNTDNSMVIDKYWLLQKDGTPMHHGTGVEMFKDFYRDWYNYADGN